MGGDVYRLLFLVIIFSWVVSNMKSEIFKDFDQENYSTILFLSFMTPKLLPLGLVNFVGKIFTSILLHYFICYMF